MKMRKAIHISFLLLFFLSAAEAQKKYIYQDSSLLQKEEPYPSDNESDDGDNNTEKIIVAAADDVVADTTLHVNGLHLSPDSILQWKKLKQYAYIKNLDSLLEMRNKKKKVETPKAPPTPNFLTRFFNSTFLRLMLWTLAICFVLFIIYRLFLTEGIFKRKEKNIDKPDAAVEEEFISPETDFDARINQALQNRQYRHAVRYQYLRTLHLLAGKNFVSLAPDKTNFEYVREMNDRAYQEVFAALTLNYEYVWYGGFEIEQDIYQKIEPGFINFNKKI